MSGQVTRLLDEEHSGTLDLLNTVEGAMLRAAQPAGDPGLIRVVGKLDEHLRQHVPRHFGFEEQSVFPPLRDAGEGDLCDLLEEEHVAINAVIAELLPLTANFESLDPPGIDALKRGIVELADRLRGHIDKETMALLPVCDDMLDASLDQELALAYACA
jgi:hemerythrin-like domain-containing protein